MEAVLAYNEYKGISGETEFFRNISKRISAELSSKGHSVHICRIPQAKGLLLPIEHYSRVPLLPKAYSMLKRHEDADILHFLNASMAPAGLRLRNRRKIATVHQLGDSLRELAPMEGLGKHTEDIYWSLYSRLDRKAYHNLDRLVACTSFQAQDLERTHGLDSSQVDVIAPGVDVDFYKQLPKSDLKRMFGCEETVAYVGRLHERSKGVSYLIRAMAHMERKSTKLVIVGDGPDKERYEKLASSLGLGNRVVFLGKLGFEEKCAIQKNADVLVVPSLYDVFCTVFAESLACSVPVVAFDMPFWKGLYDDAALFVDKDPESLAEGIWMVLDDKPLRKRLVSRGKSLVSNYDYSRTVSDYVSLYERLLG
jgi:glycosyltransferase involved in cell wall biosynthesis